MLKVHVYDNENNIFYDNNKYEIILHLHSEALQIKEKNNMETSSYIVLSYEKNKEARLLQYTGLNTSNGREVYEGDVIYCKGEKWLIEPINSVLEGTYQQCASYNGNGILYAIDEDLLKGEIIGNIFRDENILD